MVVISIDGRGEMAVRGLQSHVLRVGAAGLSQVAIRKFRLAGWWWWQVRRLRNKAPAGRTAEGQPANAARFVI